MEVSSKVKVPHKLSVVTHLIPKFCLATNVSVDQFQ